MILCLTVGKTEKKGKRTKATFVFTSILAFIYLLGFKEMNSIYLYHIDVRFSKCLFLGLMIPSLKSECLS